MGGNGFAPYILPTLLKLIEDEYPDLEPRIVENQTEELLQRLRDGQIDVAVLATPTGATGVSEIPLYDETFAVITAPDEKWQERPLATVVPSGDGSDEAAGEYLND